MFAMPIVSEVNRHGKAVKPTAPVRTPTQALATIDALIAWEREVYAQDPTGGNPSRY